MNRRQITPIDEVLAGFSRVFLDNCAITQYLEDMIDEPQNLLERIEIYRRAVESLRHYKELIEDGAPLYLTEGVLAELNSGARGHKYKKRMAKLQDWMASHGAYERAIKLRLERIKREVFRTRNGFIDMLNLHERVFHPTESQTEHINLLRRTNNGIKVKHGIGDVDYKLILSCAVLANGDESIALVSNDYPLLHVWADLVLAGQIDAKKMVFYLRRQKEGLERADNPRRQYSERSNIY